MSGIKCFWMKPEQLVEVSLRLFRGTDHRCAAGGEFSYCDTSVVIHEQAPLRDWLIPSHFEGEKRVYNTVFKEGVADDDPRWPAAVCTKCSEPMVDPVKQLNAHELHSGSPDGKLYTLWNEPVGAMWDCEWMRNDDGADHGFTGPDGISLCVRTPGGLWMVDSQASNCTRKQEVPAPTADHPNTFRFVRTHYCWIRHGDPRTGNIHVDKSGGETCSAGAGSIQCGNYHGFLHNGHLTAA